MNVYVESTERVEDGKLTWVPITDGSDMVLMRLEVGMMTITVNFTVEAVDDLIKELKRVRGMAHRGH